MGDKCGDGGGGGFQLVRRTCAKSRRQDLLVRRTINHFLSVMLGGIDMKGATVKDEFREAERESLTKGRVYPVGTLDFVVHQ